MTATPAPRRRRPARPPRPPQPPWLCVNCGHEETSWAAIQRHAHAAHGAARIEQPGLAP